VSDQPDKQPPATGW